MNNQLTHRQAYTQTKIDRHTYKRPDAWRDMRNEKHIHKKHRTTKTNTRTGQTDKQTKTHTTIQMDKHTYGPTNQQPEIYTIHTT